jgi:hypothetical protein
MPQRNALHRQLFASLKSGPPGRLKGTLSVESSSIAAVRAMVSTPSERKPPGVFFGALP